MANNRVTKRKRNAMGDLSKDETSSKIAHAASSSSHENPHLEGSLARMMEMPVNIFEEVGECRSSPGRFHLCVL